MAREGAQQLALWQGPGILAVRSCEPVASSLSLGATATLLMSWWREQAAAQTPDLVRAWPQHRVLRAVTLLVVATLCGLGLQEDRATLGACALGQQGFRRARASQCSPGCTVTRNVSFSLQRIPGEGRHLLSPAAGPWLQACQTSGQNRKPAPRLELLRGPHLTPW